MEFTTEEVMALEALVGHPGFDLLVKLLREQEQSVLAHLVAERDEKDIVYLTRFWQVLRQLTDIIAAKPHDAKTEIESLLASGGLDPAFEFCRHGREGKT